MKKNDIPATNKRSHSELEQLLAEYHSANIELQKLNAKLTQELQKSRGQATAYHHRPQASQ